NFTVGLMNSKNSKASFILNISSNRKSRSMITDYSSTKDSNDFRETYLKYVNVHPPCK
ncbi:8682_t:CDS:2, partial [Racocetra persica]